jgi:hypothetical protein
VSKRRPQALPLQFRQNCNEHNPRLPRRLRPRVAHRSRRVAALGILGNLYFLVATLLAPKVDVAAQVKAQNPNMPAEQAEMASKVASYVTNAGPAIYVTLLLVHGLILFGGIQMLRLRSYGLALASGILGVIPCASPCCVLGIPFGTWALIVLMRPEVKAAFH